MPRRTEASGPDEITESVKPPEADAAAPATVHTLADGHLILIRPLLASDRAQLAERYAALSPATRRARFGSAPEHLSTPALDQLVDLDYDDRFALGAVAIDEPGAPGVGVARYARDPDDPTQAEAAVIVVDAYQHRGIGTILLRSLIAVARAHGISTLTGSVLWENDRLLEAVRGAGATLEPAEPGIAVVRFQIPDEDLTDPTARPRTTWPVLRAGP